MHMQTGVISMPIFVLPADRLKPSNIMDHFVDLNTGIKGADV